MRPVSCPLFCALYHDCSCSAAPQSRSIELIHWPVLSIIHSEFFHQFFLSEFKILKAWAVSRNFQVILIETLRRFFSLNSNTILHIIEIVVAAILNFSFFLFSFYYFLACFPEVLKFWKFCPSERNQTESLDRLSDDMMAMETELEDHRMKVSKNRRRQWESSLLIAMFSSLYQPQFITFWLCPIWQLNLSLGQIFCFLLAPQFYLSAGLQAEERMREAENRKRELLRIGVNTGSRQMQNLFQMLS